MSTTKPIGKLKKGDLFYYGDSKEVMVVTASGHGRPHVEFTKRHDRRDTYICVHKKNHVLLYQNRTA